MCRWLAYSGPPIYLDSLILKPEHSLVAQSRRAFMSASVTNGDGFGVGWYGERPEPGLLRDTLPAWNDENLKSVSEQIRSPLFFAHVRASTDSATTRDNCHPFRHGRWLFMHNGLIGGFEQVRRELALAIAPSLYPCLRGTTDSETFFYLLLGNGLEHDPGAAFVATVAQVMDAMITAGVRDPFKMAAAVSDGQTVTALRFASDGEAPSLFYGCGVTPRDHSGATREPAGNSVLILSEPLDHAEEQWIEVPDSHLLVAGDGGVAILPFAVTTS